MKKLKVGDKVRYVGTMDHWNLDDLLGVVLEEDSGATYLVEWPIAVAGSPRVRHNIDYIEFAGGSDVVAKSVVWDAMIAASQKMGLTYDEAQRLSDALEAIGITGPKTEVTITMKVIVDEDTNIEWVKQFAEQRGYEVTEFNVTKETE